ncbi:hypothetical protein HMPREF3213_01672 [Heyndrickxia coagulans]|uniref:Uncharacterized protein n=1 Tax=Heyndrickxia coagulans TaxID=1398 RepID=A0A133KTV7_HEYCO|nr:hypothetical protein HMPREF3213_01672 [Heyndrickxia coagulans]
MPGLIHRNANHANIPIKKMDANSKTKNENLKFSNQTASPNTETD